MNEPGSAVLFQPDREALQKLGKMYRFSRIRYLLLLLIPVLWILGGYLSGFSSMDDLVAGILIAWFFVVFFGVGAWVFLLIPDKEEIKRKYVSHVLPFLFRKEGIEITYHPSHDLSVNSLLKSGLYHDRYSTILREDCIAGSAGRMNFGMYQVAVQATSGFNGGRYSPSSRVMTNLFFGWVIHCIIPSTRGTHVILPKHRKTEGESDDWLMKVGENWWQNPKCPAYETGYQPFDEEFILYSDQPEVFHSFATKEFMDFLLYLQKSSSDAFAINVSGNLLMMHMGHAEPSFRYCPDGDFVSEVHPDLEQDVKWFTSLLKGVQRFTASAKP